MPAALPPTQLVAFDAITPAEQRELADWRAFYRECERKYGTPARPFGEREYVALYVAQHGRCAICRKAKGRDPRAPLAYAGRARKPRRLGVDHNHLTGLVRGLLCTGGDKTCNRIIGWLDRPALERALAYVTEPPAIAALLDTEAWLIKGMGGGS